MVADRVLVDRFGRIATDLRISLTDRCSLRCTYCMPAEGLDWLPKAQMLTDDEIVTLAEVFIAYGVNSVRLTGGEPMLHQTLADVIARLAACTPRPELSLTTNGIGLADKAERLVAAGLDRVNVSIDTLQPERFLQLTRRNRHADVLDGVAAAAAAGLSPIKINAVLMRDSNLAEAPALLEWALRQGYEMRFIEHMPLDAQQEWNRASMVSADEILELLGRTYQLRPIGHGPDGSAPAEEFVVEAGPGLGASTIAGHPASHPARVGIIASVTRPFCRDCDRLRLTSDGQLRTCLFAHDETDLRGPLRDGATADELGQILIDAVAGKQAGHGIDSGRFLQPTRPMSAIGG